MITVEEQIGNAISKANVRKYKITVTTSIPEYFPVGATMMYDYHENEIYINSEEVTKQDSGLPLEDYIYLLLVHEIGHHIHDEREGVLMEIKRNEVISSFKNSNYFFIEQYPLYKNLILYREKEAWREGRKIVSTNLKKEFDYINEINIRCYSSNTEDELLKEKLELKEKYNIK